VFACGFGPDAVEAVCAGDGLDEEEMLDLIAGLVDKRIGSALIGLGSIAMTKGDLVQARLLAEDSLVEYRKAGDRERARWSLEAIALLALAEGDLAQAAKLLEQSLNEARDLGNEAGVAEASVYLARVAHARGDLVGARSLCEEGLGLARRLRERMVEGDGLVVLTELELDLGKTDRALRAARAREELEFIERELAAAYGLGGMARRLDDPVERARKAVSNRIRDAMARIEAEHAALGRHLRASIRTGTFCSYQPERTVTWEVRPTR
jgi:tetratricopeptide (TPR) repeat protein